MILFIIVLLASFFLTFIVKFFAEKRSLLDVPNERSLHIKPTARGGGIAIVLTWFPGITYLFFSKNIDPNLYFALMSGLLISVISFIDDIYKLTYLPRLIVQAIATIIALFFIGGLKKIDIGFYIIENSFFLTLLIFFSILWFINLFNFIDGIDGYAATEAIFVSLALIFFLKDTFLLLFAASILGFIPWNWDKAKIFMGDIGSTLLGFTLAVFAVYYQNITEFSIFNWLILTSVFWFDATYTLFNRLRNKEKLNQAHKKHIYQRIVQSGFTHQKTVLFSLAINFILFLLVFFTYEHNKYILFCLGANLIFLYWIKKIVDRKIPFV